jgi:hypothetical protein
MTLGRWSSSPYWLTAAEASLWSSRRRYRSRYRKDHPPAVPHQGFKSSVPRATASHPSPAAGVPFHPNSLYAFIRN